MRAYRKEFLQNLSHEFKTPVFAIQGYVDTLLNGALERKEVNRKFLENASRNVDRLVNLIDDLDEISRLESGEVITCRNPISLSRTWCVKYLNHCRSRRRTKMPSAALRKDVNPRFPFMPIRKKHRQVLINLVDNAIKYGKQNGIIEASIYNTDGKNILVEISDDGFGYCRRTSSPHFRKILPDRLWPKQEYRRNRAWACHLQTYR